MKNFIIGINLILLIACNQTENKGIVDHKVDSTLNYKKCQALTDSIDFELIPIYNDKTTSTSKNGLAIQVLLDSILQYKKIRQLIKDSSGTIYLVHELRNGEETSKKSVRVSTKNILVAIYNSDMSNRFLLLKFDYKNETITVLNGCKGQDSLSLYEWKKNCW